MKKLSEVDKIIRLFTTQLKALDPLGYYSHTSIDSNYLTRHQTLKRLGYLRFQLHRTSVLTNPSVIFSQEFRSSQYGPNYLLAQCS